jgi:hypothetical protein
MFRFESDLRLIGAIIDGVEEMHRAHAVRGSFDTHDLINWLNAHHNPELNDIISYYAKGDVLNVATVQIGNYLKNRLDQRKVGDQISTRCEISLKTGARPGGDSEVSVWQISPSTRAGLDRARVSLFANAQTSELASTTALADFGWLGRISGSFKDEPAFAEVVEYGRTHRSEGRTEDSDNS